MKKVMDVRDYVGKGAIGLLIAAFIFFGLKGCVVSIWSSPKSVETYSIQGEDGRSISMIFLPGHQTMLWYQDPKEQHVEGVLTRMKGSYGVHYFWRVWHVEGPGITFGYRIYPADTEPVYMEITVLERYMVGRGNPNFPKKGERIHQVLLFGEDVVEFDGMWLRREPTDPEVVEALLADLGGPQPLH